MELTSFTTKLHKTVLELEAYETRHWMDDPYIKEWVGTSDSLMLSGQFLFKLFVISAVKVP